MLMQGVWFINKLRCVSSIDSRSVSLGVPYVHIFKEVIGVEMLGLNIGF
ncbi:hypothetical protein [Vulcanisaeta sp. JCM 16159]|nr:hypothetical protein [Vulcanisaeta sp. JCM 16159]